MSLCQGYLSRRIPTLSKLCHYSVQTQLQTQLLLARNVSTASARLLHARHARPNSKRHAIKSIRWQQRYLSTDQPPVPRPDSHGGTSIAFDEDVLHHPRHDGGEESTTTSASLHADTLPISCPGCGAYAQTIEPSEPGYYSRTRKKAKKLWHKRQQVIAKDKQLSRDGEEEVVDGDETAGAELSGGKHAPNLTLCVRCMYYERQTKRIHTPSRRFD